MLFNSFDFFIFLPIVFCIHWFVFNNTARSQNCFLLFASFVFYSWVSYKFLLLILSSIGCNYFIGKKVRSEKNEKIEVRWLRLGVLINVGLLGYFKYFDFFRINFFIALNYLGLELNIESLNIILPLGISFFTFQNIGYLIDVFNEELDPEGKIENYALFVAFFPKLLSGPIERAGKFLPQIEKKRYFDPSLAVDGAKQFLWGLFAKIVIADNCATFVNPILLNYENEPGSVLFIAMFLFIIQVYSDFSGYSNMALGISKLFGIKLSINFAKPLFALNISDFWKKWHISLTTWMMDYVFTPLSFLTRRYKEKGLLFSISCTFILVGLWHGANWTFLLFGIIQSLLFFPLVLKGELNKNNSIAVGRLLPSIREISAMILTFILVMFSSLLMVAENISQAFDIYLEIFSASFFTFPDIGLIKKIIFLLILILFFLSIEWVTRNEEHPFDFFKKSKPLRWLFLSFIILLMGIFMSTKETEFIYLQF